MRKYIQLIKRSHWLAAIVLVAVFAPGAAQAQSFRAAHATDGFFRFEYALINNDGVVVFSAGRRDSSGKVFTGVYKSAGGTIRTVAESADLDPTTPGQIRVLGGSGIWINGRGDMAMSGFYQGFARVFVGRGTIGPNQMVGTVLSGGLLPTVTDNGYVAFGRLVQPYPYDPASQLQPCTTCEGQGRLNNRGQYLLLQGTNIHIVTIGTVTQEGDSRIFLQPVRTNRVAGFSVDAFIAGTSPMLNDNGTVAYFDIPAAGVTGLYKNPASPVVEQRSGSEFTFNGHPPFALNNQGQVAFLAHSRTFAKVGFFRGPNPLSDKIVVVGDTVAGSQLSSLSTPVRADRWFNDGGQIVFQATDNNGIGLWVTGGVASPPPTNVTTTLHWIGPGITPPSGSFGVPSNWEPPTGESPRVPEKTITRRDIAIFDRPEVYTVTIGDRYNEGVVIRNGNVTFIDGTYKVDALSFAQPSFVIDNARLAVGTGMTLTNNHALIGQSAASRVDVNFFGKWVTFGSLRVGGSGQGILAINDGGWVKSAEARIGTGAGGGRAIVTDSGKWTNGSMAIGMGGVGELIMTNGGFVESDLVSVGAQIGTSGRVSVLGSTINGPTMWHPLAAVVGDKSFGELRVTNGALANVEFYLKVGADSYGIGTVRVSGVDAQDRPASLYVQELLVGVKGQANFSIENGGYVVTKNVGVGTEGTGRGTLVVDGAHSASGILSELAADTLTVGGAFDSQGPTGKGTVEIKNGALVGVNVCYLFCAQAGRKSEMIVTGSGSELIVTNLLMVGYYTGNQGDAVLTLNNAYVEASYVDVMHNGTIRGVGTLRTTARLMTDNGTISPGLSPGVLTIEGNYEQGPNGRMLVEIGGTNTADYDQLIVTSNATLSGNLVLHFLNGFAPKTGDSFSFLNVGGAGIGEFSAVGLENLAPGFQFQFVTNGAQLGITALNDGVYSTALPGGVQVVVTNIGGFTYASYTITTSNTCGRITLSGPLTQTSNVFSQAFQGTTLVKADCIAEIAATNGAILLGHLSPGDYSFRVMSNTQVVETVAFTITSEAAQTLSSPVRLADGSLQFEINGLAPIGYTVEASADLETWSPLEQGVLPFTYVDPDAAIFPQRFYRAIIAP